jgi:NADPH-dependent 2,4-dienoyl-CoA reductase/sulfur reductase-like enzyme/rhodanese-related sulfurtransferase
VAQEITTRDALLVVTPAQFEARHRIRVHLKQEVTAINPAEKSISVRDLETGEVRNEPYDSLILTPGAKAIMPPIAMVDASNVFTMRTIPDMDKVSAYLEDTSHKNATVIGAGYIGLEMVEALRRRGIHVTLVEKLKQVLPPLDEDMAFMVADHIRQAGVILHLGDGVRAFSGADGKVSQVELESGTVVPADLVIMSIGVRPDAALAVSAGLKLGSTGAIAVDSAMKTSDPHIWAAGDAVESIHRVTGKPAWVALAGPANKQGRVAGANAAGGTMSFSGVLGTSIVRFNEIVAAVTGLNERVAKASGYDVQTSIIHANNHAGYYPQAELVTTKVVYDRQTGRLLGAEVIGNEGVDKRIDVFATALHANMSVEDLTELDLAYAPPFGSARDPVNVAGFVAQNQISNAVDPISSGELENLLASDTPVQLVDVRTTAEFAEKHIRGAHLIPVDELRTRIGEIKQTTPVVVYCRVGLRGYLASRILKQNGYSVRNLSGGIRSWRFETRTNATVPGPKFAEDVSRA